LSKEREKEREREREREREGERNQRSTSLVERNDESPELVASIRSRKFASVAPYYPYHCCGGGDDGTGGREYCTPYASGRSL
jgi:hypothetical protein